MSNKSCLRIAQTFWQRLRGISRCKVGEVLLIPNCCCVHGFGLDRPLLIYFLDANYQLLSQRRLLPWRIAVNWKATHVLERIDHLPSLDRAPSRGFSVLESLVALPVLLFFSSAILQIGLLWHSKFAITHAATVAARHASVLHGSNDAIRDGLVAGLVPLITKTGTFPGWTGEMFRSQAEIAIGMAAGWLRWEVLSPTRQSFMDWGQAADVHLSPGASAGEVEIPSEHLQAISLRKIPATGIAGYAHGLPIGVASGQTLLEANTLKVNLRVGIPLQMPVAGPVLARALALWSGCGSIAASQESRVGLVNFGHGVTSSGFATSIECRALAARDAQGRWRPRWPVEAAAAIQMQSNARRSVMVLRDRRQTTREALQ